MIRTTISIPYILKDIGRIFSENGFNAYLVGGAVRDTLMGRPPTDFDITTDARPDQMQKLFPRTIPTGIEHGTITILFKKHHIEATTFRADQGYTDGRHPDSIAFADTIQEDLSRRDFTMNAIAADLQTGVLVDPYNGQIDIQNHVIRTVGAPAERFSEDGLRPLRGIRFAAQLGFSLEQNTYEAMAPALPITKKVAVERFHDEFCKIILSQNPVIGFRLMEEIGITNYFIPELCQCRGVEQRGMHTFDVLDHLYYSCAGCPRSSLIVKTAALFHDIGKPRAQKQTPDGTYTFYQHDFISASMTKTILRRLKFSNTQIDAVCALIEMHMFHYEPVWTDAAVRRFLAKASSFTTTASESMPERTIYDVINDLFDLRRGDTFGMTGTSASSCDNNLSEFADRISALLQADCAVTLKNLAVSGSDLIAAGIPAGRHMGHILQELLNTVIDSPDMNTKEALLKIAVNIFKQTQN